MRARKTLHVVVVVVIVVVVAACAFALLAGYTGARAGRDPRKLESRRKTTFQYFGTVCFVSVYDDFSTDSGKSRFEEAWAEIVDMLAGLEASASPDKAGSDVRRFNDARGGESVPIRATTADIIALAHRLHESTGGAFNPAVANLVDLWGFSPRFRNKSDIEMPYDRPVNEKGGFGLPDARYVEAFRQLSDFSLARLGGSAERGFFLTKEADDIVIDGVPYSLKIDLGGIAKGYGADKAAAILEAHGYEYGYVNLGLSSMKLLKRNVSDAGAPGPNMWAVSISDPVDSTKNFVSLFGKDTGLSTSGTYDISYSMEGREYSHIIDGTTGEPTGSDILSATVLGPDAASDDALSTALCVMGSERAEEFMKTRMKDYKTAMIVRREGGRLDLVTTMGKRDYSLSRE